ncbi:tetratricopeptide repeat protein [Streptomyces albipurpureus]|uniref:tetratricopeptide repeat protein n=1 Tax=Streptomyces albipurpureus TaxID=2897419 RepID=UPI003CE50629
MTSRESNIRLKLLLKEAGWTNQQVIHAVSKVGAEHGMCIRYTRQSVSQWVKGHMPQKEVRPLILEALARKLGRPIPHSEAGFPAPPPDPNNCPTAEGLIELGRQDVERRNFLGASLFTVALTIPDWQDVVGRMESVQSGVSHRIGMADVQLVTKMTDRLSGVYDDFGGRHTRPMAGTFLADVVAPYLRAEGPTEVRKAMMSAASYLCYLTGWMAVDEGLHGLAQKYYVKGLELAGASGDHMTYCHVLRGISVQAVDLGHGPMAVRLANAAATVSPQTGPRMRAFMAGQQAHSFAVAGDRTNALRSIRETEKAMDKAESTPTTFGGYDPAVLAYHVSQVRHALGDVSGSVESLHLHFRLRAPGDTRRSALRFSSILAERQLEIGHLEAACKTWNQVLDEYPAIHSGRVDRHVASIGPLLRPYQKNPIARDLYERATLSAKRVKTS